jgi:hypothetical protein
MEYSNGDNDRMSRDFLDIDILSRAQGSLLGQLAGDSLGSMVEFRLRMTSGGNTRAASGN